MKNKDKKKEQLGVDPGTASHTLRKMVMFDMAKQLGLTKCYQCGEEIETVSEFSVEHKIPWLDSENPSELFFDLNNIAFSHLSCNIAAARNPRKGNVKHPSSEAYKQGCRCDECREIEKLRRRDQRSRGIRT